MMSQALFLAMVLVGEALAGCLFLGPSLSCQELCDEELQRTGARRVILIGSVADFSCGPWSTSIKVNLSN